MIVWSGLCLSHEVEHSRVQGSPNLWVEKEQLTIPLLNYRTFIFCFSFVLSFPFLASRLLV